MVSRGVHWRLPVPAGVAQRYDLRNALRYRQATRERLGLLTMLLNKDIGTVAQLSERFYPGTAFLRIDVERQAGVEPPAHISRVIRIARSEGVIEDLLHPEAGRCKLTGSRSTTQEAQEDRPVEFRQCVTVQPEPSADPGGDDCRTHRGTLGLAVSKIGRQRQGAKNLRQLKQLLMRRVNFALHRPDQFGRQNKGASSEFSYHSQPFPPANLGVEGRRGASGANLTFKSRLGPCSWSNVKFESSTSIIYLLVVLMILTFARTGAAGGSKCRNRTTSSSLAG